MMATTLPDFDVAAATLKPGTVAIITGAAEGLGKGFAEALLKKGAKGVCLADFNVVKGMDTLAELSGEFGADRVMFVNCDVKSSHDMEVVFKKTKAKFGRVNVVVNNAGIVNERKWEMCIETNLNGTILGTNLALRYMGPEENGEGGHIVNIASVAVVLTPFFLPVYTATKYAVVGWTKAIAKDPSLSAQGIKLGVLCPSNTRTAITASFDNARSERDKQIAVAAIKSVPMLEVADVAKAFLRLLLDESCAGKVMTVNKEKEGVRMEFV